MIQEILKTLSLKILSQIYSYPSPPFSFVKNMSSSAFASGSWEVTNAPCSMRFLLCNHLTIQSPKLVLENYYSLPIFYHKKALKASNFRHFRDSLYLFFSIPQMKKALYFSTMLHGLICILYFTFI